MNKTAVVEMVWKQRHPLYRKQVRRVARFYVHDPQSQCEVGDTVRIQETRPISKTKHWRLLEILQRRQVAEVRPIELEADVEPVMTGEALLEAPESPEERDSAEDSAEDDEDTD
jgi:small subunit ribosomal protein S17